MLRLNYEAPKEFEDAIRSKLSPGEELITWCEVFEVQIDLSLSISAWAWSFLALTNINIRQGTWQTEEVSKAGLFKAQQIRSIPKIASSSVYPISQVTTSNLEIADPVPQVNKLLSQSLEEWRLDDQIGALTISLTNGAMTVVNSPYREIEELTNQLDLARTQTTSVEHQSSEGALDKIKKLAELHEAGVLTDEEFESKKAKLLDEI